MSERLSDGEVISLLLLSFRFVTFWEITELNTK